MIKVQVRPNEPLEAALRRFKRQCNYAGIFRMAKKYAYHEKRSDKNRREERERIRTIKQAMRKLEGGGKRSRRKSKVKGGQDQANESSVMSDTGPTSKPASKPAASPATDTSTTTSTPATGESQS